MATSKRIPIADLKPDPKNPRTMTPEARAGLGVSLEEFGPLDIVFNQRSGELVSGHQRMDGLKAAGATEVVMESDEWGFVEHPKTGDRFPIRFVNWDDMRQRMANLTANNPHLQGEFSGDLAKQLAEVEEQAQFDALRLAELAEDHFEEAAALEGETDPDDAPELPEDAITETGDLWILGDHRLLCGDSTSAADVALLMGGEKAMLLATDPPYGVDYNAGKKGIVVDGKECFKDWGDIENDALAPKDLADFLKRMFEAAAPVMSERPALYVWHPGGSDLQFVFRDAIVNAGWLIHRTIIWAKTRFVLGRLGMYHYQHEPCFYGWMKTNMPPWYGEKNQTTVWNVGRDDGAKFVHPTQKPVELFERPMLNHTRPGEVCLELFSGSGSQIIAGERLRRRVFAMEMSPRYVDVAVKRWENFTGRTAERTRPGGSR